MKIAFITHAIGVGGGSLSSSNTIRYLIDHEYLKPDDCIIIHAKTKEETNEKNDVYYCFREKVKFYEFNIPFSPVFKGSSSNIFINLYQNYNEIISCLLFILKYNKILKRENITVVHLNSIVLWPLLLVLPTSIKKVIHIREVPNNSLESRIAIFIIKRNATKIISIDPISNIHFSKSSKSIVILNPFTMSTSRFLRRSKKSIKSEMGIHQNKFIVSIIGRVEKMKGFDFFIKIVKAMEHNENLLFLIIGNYYEECGKKYIDLLQNQSNVKILGVHNDVTKFYAITDVVIRCEDYLPLGRTVWEGIFAGGIALVPVNSRDDISVIQEYLGKYIYTYQALNVDSCIETLTEIIKKFPDTVIDSGYPSTDNVATSAEQFYREINI